MASMEAYAALERKRSSEGSTPRSTVPLSATSPRSDPLAEEDQRGEEEFVSKNLFGNLSIQMHKDNKRYNLYLSIYTV